MKKTIIIIASVLLVIVLAFLCFNFLIQRPQELNNDVFAISNEAQLKEYIEEKVERYSFDGDMAFLGQIKLFATTADIEFYMTDGSVDEIDAVFTIFRFDDGVIIEDNAETDNSEEYVFTSEDKEKIENSFVNIKKEFEKYIGCTFDSYDVRATHDVEGLENTEESFYAGDFIKEYSVRDNNGRLWVMRYEASYGSASVVIQKITNESGYDGFIPTIDMTKK